MNPDRFILEFDKALRTVFAPAATRRPVPGAHLPEAPMPPAEKDHAARLMRINHVGEVCAQALYQGQALACRDPAIRRALEGAAHEETEHLAWTERRIAELGGRKSLLNPLWYLGALSLGVAAGRLGDAWSLGFLVETERQVEAHLDSHLAGSGRGLPPDDVRSREIVEQMKQDEITHAETAGSLGARALPLRVKLAMKLSARVMTRTAYHL